MKQTTLHNGKASNNGYKTQVSLLVGSVTIICLACTAFILARVFIAPSLFFLLGTITCLTAWVVRLLRKRGTRFWL